MKSSALIIVCILSSLNLFAQDLSSLMESLNSENGQIDIHIANQLYEKLYEEAYCDSLITFNAKQTHNGIKTRLFPVMAMYLYDKQQYGESMRIAKEGAAAAEDLKDEEMMAECLSIIGIIYQIYGEYEAALDFAQQAYKLNRDDNDVQRSAIRLSQIAAVYSAMKDSQNAMDYYLKAVDIMEAGGNYRSLSICYCALGDMATEQGQLELATTYYQKALLKQSDPAKAADYYAHALILSDSLFKAESEKQINIEKQQPMIASHKKNSSILVVLIIFCLIIICLLLFIVCRQRQRNRDLAELNNAKNKFFSIISHDLKNPLIAQNNAIALI